MTGANDNLQTSDFRPDGPVERLFRGPRNPAYWRVVVAFGVASATHLWLADAAQPEWWFSNIVYVLGLAVLLATRSAAGWLICAIALTIPLLFLRDQLTQSVLLLTVCATGVLTIWRRVPNVAGFLATARGLLVVTYGVAAFHKLNHDFFDPAVGCATYGLVELAEYYRLDSATFSTFQDAHALLAVSLELAIPVAYLLGRRHLARVCAVLFHIPLTMTMAPAFAFVMAVGHAAYLTDDDVARFAARWRTNHRGLLAASAIFTAASLLAHGAWPEWTMVPREAALWFALFWCVLVLRDGAATPEKSVQFGTIPIVLVAAFSLNVLTPYLGVQFQHTGAMLSNLRIDEGCWNHFVMPEAIRVTDDYLRIDDVSFAQPGAIPEYEAIVRDQLWSPPQLLQMRRNWCRDEVRPLEMSGTYRGEQWSIADLCDPDEEWPFEADGIFGVELFPNFLRFQKNLERACPQACIH